MTEYVDDGVCVMITYTDENGSHTIPEYDYESQST